MFALKIIKIINKNWDEDKKHVTGRETNEAYTKLFSSVDDVIEEWIARTIMLISFYSLDKYLSTISWQLDLQYRLGTYVEVYVEEYESDEQLSELLTEL